MKKITILIAAIYLLPTKFIAQQWDFLVHDTSENAFNFILPADDGGHFALNNAGNFYNVIRFDASDNRIWTSSVECQDDIWISSFLMGPDGHIYVEGEQYQTAYFPTDTLTGHNHFIARYDATDGTEYLHVMPTDHGITEMFVNENDNFTVFGYFGGWSANYTLINGDTIFAKTSRDAMIMTMNTDFEVLDTIRIWSDQSYTSFTQVYQNAGRFDMIMNNASTIYFGGNDSLPGHQDHRIVHWELESGFNLATPERLNYTEDGSSLSSFHFETDGTYLVMRQTSWGNPSFGTNSFTSDGNNKQWLIKLDNSGDLESSKLISSTGNQYVTFDMLLAPNDTFYILGEANREFTLDQGQFYTPQYKYNMYVFTADKSLNTSMYSTIEDTNTGGTSLVYGAHLIDGNIYACGYFSDTVKIDGQTFAYPTAHGWYGKLEFVSSNDTTTSVQETSNMQCNIYPNPTHGQVILTDPSAQIETIQLFDMRGSLVYSTTLNQGLMHQINLDAIPDGVYVVQLKGGEINETKKLVVRH